MFFKKEKKGVILYIIYNKKIENKLGTQINADDKNKHG